jgi:hypothetical protein
MNLIIVMNLIKVMNVIKLNKINNTLICKQGKVQMNI